MVKITQTGATLSLDLGNGIVMKGDVKDASVALEYKLTEHDAAQPNRVQNENGPKGEEERKADIQALTGKVVKYTAALTPNEEYGESIAGDLEDWKAVAVEDRTRQVSVTSVPVKLKLNRKPCGEDQEVRIAIHAPAAQGGGEPVIAAKSSAGAITLVNNDIEVARADIAARLVHADDLTKVEGIPDSATSPVAAEHDLVRIDISRTKDLKPVFLNAYAMALQADGSVAPKPNNQSPIVYADGDGSSPPIRLWRESTKTTLVTLPHALAEQQESLYVEGVAAGRYRLVVFQLKDGDLAKAKAVTAAEHDPNKTPAAAKVDLTPTQACSQNARLTVALADIFQEKQRERVFDVLVGGRARIDARLWPPNGTYTFSSDATATWMRNHDATGATPAVADGKLGDVTVNDTGEATAKSADQIVIVHGGFQPTMPAVRANVAGTGLYTASLSLDYQVEGARLRRDEPLTVMVPTSLDITPQGFAINQIVEGSNTDFSFKVVYRIFDQNGRLLKGPTDPKAYTRQYGARLRMYEALGGVAGLSTLRRDELFWTYPGLDDVKLGTAPRVRAKPDGASATNSTGQFNDNFYFNLTNDIRNFFDNLVQKGAGNGGVAPRSRIFAANQDIVALLNNDAAEYDVRVVRANVLEALAPDSLAGGRRGPLGFRMVLGGGEGAQAGALLNTGHPDRVAPDHHP